MLVRPDGTLGSLVAEGNEEVEDLASGAGLPILLLVSSAPLAAGEASS